MKKKLLLVVFFLIVRLNSMIHYSTHTLENGLKVILVPRNDIPQVTMQIWYKVGSKNETDNDRGIAHMIEHMIFKGTEKLPEGALSEIVYKLSGYCNAFTSYDYTGYLFDVPSCNYKLILPIMADCMENCVFDQQCLNSELKAVFQELRMYKDNNFCVMRESGVMPSLFRDHPYYHPIIGYKSTIANYTSEQLKQFYKKWYSPDNATLIIVGDIDEHECIEEIKKNFEPITAQKNNDKNNLYRILCDNELDTTVTHSVVYRPVQVPYYMIAWKVDEISSQGYLSNGIFATILGSGNSSLLYKKLVDQENLATEVGCFVHELFDQNVVYIYYQPKSLDSIDSINTIIFDSIKKIQLNEIEDSLYETAIKKGKMYCMNQQENNESTANHIGIITLGTNDLQSFNKSLNFDKQYIQQYCIKTASLMTSLSYSSVLLKPLAEDQKKIWEVIQKQKDTKDQHLLDSIVRSNHDDLNHVKNKFVYSELIPQPKNITFPQFEKHTFENNSVLYTVKRNIVDKVEICISFKTSHLYDPWDKLGINAFLFSMMNEGTKNYPGNTFLEILESYGIDFSCSDGMITLTCLPEDTQRAIDLLYECICHPQLSDKAFNKVYDEFETILRDELDNNYICASKIIKSHIYNNHPYCKNTWGTLETIKNISLEDIREAYKKFITPHDMVVVVCGTCDMEKIKEYWNNKFIDFKGESIGEALDSFPEKLQKNEIIHYELPKDQSVFALAMESVERFNKFYTPLIILDQIFTGGSGSNMNNQLFMLREKTGYFYNIGGSLVAGAGKHPGIIFIRALTNPTLIQKSQQMILEELNNNISQCLTDTAIEDSKRSLCHGLVDLISTYKSICTSIVFLHRYDLSPDYFEQRMHEIMSVSKDSIIEAIDTVIKNNKYIIVTVGRK
jgi:zinc protease